MDIKEANKRVRDFRLEKCPILVCVSTLSDCEMLSYDGKLSISPSPQQPPPPPPPQEEGEDDFVDEDDLYA